MMMDMNSVRLKVKGYFDTKARISLKYFKVSHKSLQNKLGRFFCNAAFEKHTQDFPPFCRDHL